MNTIDRYLLGYNWGNVFGTDQRLSYQLTTSSDAKRLLSNAVSYTAPFPWRHELSLFFAHARSEIRLDSGPVPLDQDGETTQASLLYAVPRIDGHSDW